MKQTKIKLTLLILILAIGFIGIKSLFQPGYYTSHDSWVQVARLYHFDEAVKNGQIPPRYSFNLLSGFGYPLFTFSYHMPWLIAEPFVLVGVSIFDTLKIVFAIGFLLSGVLIFVYLASLYGNLAAFMGAFLYLWAPYRFGVIFVRGALGEATSYLFMPLIFYGLTYKVPRKKGILIGAVGLAGLLLSHAMIIVLLFIPLLIYIFVNWKLSSTKRPYIFKTLATLVLGGILAAYYVLPATLYQPLTIFSNIKKDFFGTQLLSIRDLLYSPWGFGTALSGPGQMSLQLGLSQWLTVIIYVIFLVFSLVKLRDAYFKKPLNIITFGVFISFSIMLLLTLTASAAVWKLIKIYVPIDFPWRIISVLVFQIAILGSYLCYSLKGIKRIGFIILILLVAFYNNRNYIRANEFTNTPVSLYVESEKTTNQYHEYLPGWARLFEVLSRKNEKITESRGQVSNLVRKVNVVSFTHSYDQPQRTRINLVYFPGMHFFIDNQEKSFIYKESGYLEVNIPAGTHDIKVTYEDTPAGKIGVVLSLVGVLTVLYLSYTVLKTRKHNK